MDRGSDKHGPRLDEAMAGETEGLVRSGHQTHAEPDRQAEPSGEDQPDVDLDPAGTLTGGTPDGMTSDDVEGRSELATYLPRSIFPALGQTLLEAAVANEAPDQVLDLLRGLPTGREYVTLEEAWEATGGGHETHRN